MKEIICHTQKELELAIKEKDACIIIKDTKEWLSVSGNATIQSVSDNATIQYVSGNATIQSVYDNATIQYVSGNATIQYVYGNATIKYVSGNATIKIFSPDVTILNCVMFAVVIMIGCIAKIKKMSKTVTIVKSPKQTGYTKEDFINIYGEDKDGNVTLYKSVGENHTDHYTGKIKYQGTVSCPDWDKNKDRQCGGGFHLSPLPHLALSYNQGTLLECKVNKKDFVVFPSDITKVRCRKVTVIGEYKE